MAVLLQKSALQWSQRWWLRQLQLQRQPASSTLHGHPECVWPDAGQWDWSEQCAQRSLLNAKCEWEESVVPTRLVQGATAGFISAGLAQSAVEWRGLPPLRHDCPGVVCYGPGGPTPVARELRSRLFASGSDVAGGDLPDKCESNTEYKGIDTTCKAKKETVFHLWFKHSVTILLSMSTCFNCFNQYKHKIASGGDSSMTDFAFNRYYLLLFRTFQRLRRNSRSSCRTPTACTSMRRRRPSFPQARDFNSSPSLFRKPRPHTIRFLHVYKVLYCFIFVTFKCNMLSHFACHISRYCLSSTSGPLSCGPCPQSPMF